jgi:hypothetical protein
MWEDWLRGLRDQPYEEKELKEMYEIENMIKSKG